MKMLRWTGWSDLEWSRYSWCCTIMLYFMSCARSNASFVAFYYNLERVFHRVRCEWLQGRKGEKGSTTRTPVIMTDNNGLPTGFIEGPPGSPGTPGIPGKKVWNFYVATYTPAVFYPPLLVGYSLFSCSITKWSLEIIIIGITFYRLDTLFMSFKQ